MVSSCESSSLVDFEKLVHVSTNKIMALRSQKKGRSLYKTFLISCVFRKVQEAARDVQNSDETVEQLSDLFAALTTTMKTTGSSSTSPVSVLSLATTSTTRDSKQTSGIPSRAIAHRSKSVLEMPGTVVCHNRQSTRGPLTSHPTTNSMTHVSDGEKLLFHTTEQSSVVDKDPKLKTTVCVAELAASNPRLPSVPISVLKRPRFRDPENVPLPKFRFLECATCSKIFSERGCYVGLASATQAECVCGDVWSNRSAGCQTLAIEQKVRKLSL